MKRDGKYILGTPKELAEVILSDMNYSRINADCIFYDCDFAIVDIDDLEELTLDEIHKNTSGWYGIKRIYPGFDSIDVDLFADYYGGTCGAYASLYDGMTEQECVREVSKVIMETLNMTESCDEDTLLIGELDVE